MSKSLPEFHNDRVFGMSLYRQVHDATNYPVLSQIERNVCSPVDEAIGDQVREQLRENLEADNG